RHPPHQEGEDQELHPRWQLRLLHEDERSAEPRLLHLPDPEQRDVQARPVARRLNERSPRGSPGDRAAPRRHISVDTFIQLTIDALTLGSVYALIALGYTLVYGVLKLLNFAHGDVFMVGSF